nr:DnaJ protein homolog [Ipomoea batatas]
MRGKLYIHFTVDFPESLSPDQCKALEGVLPPRPSKQITDMELDECEETTLHDVNIEEEMRRKVPIESKPSKLVEAEAQINRYFDFDKLQRKLSQDESQAGLRKAAHLEHPDKGGDARTVQAAAQAYEVLEVTLRSGDL